MKQVKNAKDTAGFTLLELSISMALLVPVFLAILSTRDVVGTSMTTLKAASDTGNHIRRVTRQMRIILRPALVSSVMTRATKSDCNKAQAAEDTRAVEDPLATAIVVPTEGDWILPETFETRTNLRFCAANGQLAVNPTALTTPRSLELQPDPQDPKDGDDNDGDGIVDEGRLVMIQDGETHLLLDNVKSFDVQFDNRVLVVKLEVFRRDTKGQVHTAVIRQRVFLRNR